MSAKPKELVGTIEKYHVYLIFGDFFLFFYWSYVSNNIELRVLLISLILDGQPRTTMHAGTTYDAHRNSINWQQMPFNVNHHVPSEPHSGAGHLPQFMPQQSPVHRPVPNNQQVQQSYGQPFPRPAVNGVFPSPPFSTSGAVMSSPPSHVGSFESRPVSAASHPGSMEHHSPNSGYNTPHGAYTTPPPSQTPHTPGKSKYFYVN